MQALLDGIAIIEKTVAPLPQTSAPSNVSPSESKVSDTDIYQLPPPPANNMSVLDAVRRTAPLLPPSGPLLQQSENSLYKDFCAEMGISFVMQDFLLWKDYNAKIKTPALAPVLQQIQVPLTEANSANSIGKHMLQMLVNTGVLDSDSIASHMQYGFFKELFCASVRTKLEAAVDHENDRPTLSSDTIWKLLTVADVTSATCTELVLASYSIEVLRYSDLDRPLSAYFTALSIIMSPHAIQLLSHLHASFQIKNSKVGLTASQILEGLLGVIRKLVQTALYGKLPHHGLLFTDLVDNEVQLGVMTTAFFATAETRRARAETAAHSKELSDVKLLIAKMTVKKPFAAAKDISGLPVIPSKPKKEFTRVCLEFMRSPTLCKGGCKKLHEWPSDMPLDLLARLKKVSAAIPLLQSSASIVSAKTTKTARSTRTASPTPSEVSTLSGNDDA